MKQVIKKLLTPIVREIIKENEAINPAEFEKFVQKCFQRALSNIDS